MPENSARFVCFRAFSARSRSKRAAGKTTLIIAKQRNGPTGDMPLTFIKEYARFEDRAEQAEPGA